MLTVALTMHSARSTNLGVGALTMSQIEILREAARRVGVDIRIEVLDWKNAQPIYIEGRDIKVREMTGRTLIDPFGYFSYVRAADLVIDIGAGDSFADIYGPRRLRRMMWMQYLCHLAGRPLILAPQTYGPFNRQLSVRAARGTLRRAILVVSRDQKSAAAIAQLAPNVEVIEASDVALRLPSIATDAGFRTANDSTGAHVGLNISGLLMNGGYSGKNMFGLNLDYPTMVRSLLQNMLDHPDIARVHLVPHVISTKRGDVEDDLQPALDLQAEFPEIVVPRAFSTPAHAKGYISALDFFAGARMHACIAAFSSGVPVVPMAYSRKFSGLFGTLGYDRTVDCTTEDSKTIITAVMAAFEARAELAQQAAPALRLGLEKLGTYEKELERILGELAAAKGERLGASNEA